MTWGYVAVAGATLVGGLVSSNQAKQAAKGASAAQTDAAMAGVEEQHNQFEAIQKLLAPYISGGTSAMNSQQDLLGLNGNDAQQKAIASIQNGSQFNALAKQGEDAILQNASATGGLRGGNTQGALAQFRPQLLQSLIDQQFSKLGSLTSIGQASAAGQASIGQQNANQVSSLLGQVGSAQAGGYLANGQANTTAANSVLNAAGILGGGLASGKLKF